MLTQSEMVALLGRPLTSTEVSNFSLYLDIAVKRLSNLVCFSLDNTDGARTFAVRDGFRTVFIDPFTEIESVKLNGRVIDTWHKKQDDAYQGAWFNSLEFDDPLYGGAIEVEATWGMGDKLPNDLAQVLAGLFGIHETEVSMVKSKKNEDFSVTYKDGPKLDSLIEAHRGTIVKYAVCQRAIQHGCVQPIYSY
ncbi:hypothetical protein MPC38_06760 [Prescottella equi]|uniref:hypothetical protein n=1 Tax=Rhodococcus hoagii TaxID=43767 RepID=UPI001F5B0AC9|nr:hypothetical protein [Prescottella equi]UNQ40946.1 hypothetical protein MPC38_06760 [Prescottella equi]